MKRALLAAVLLVACSRTAPGPVGFQGVSDERVPDEVVDEAAADVGACLGVSCDPLGQGWSFWYAAEVSPIDGRFSCAEATECGPRPSGCSCDSDCPCRCVGLTIPRTLQVVLTPELEALRHELIHVCGNVVTHSGPEWDCQ